MINPFSYEDLDIAKLVKEAYANRYKVGDVVEMPDPLIKIDGHGIAFKGSVLEFSGLSKSRKSTIMAMIVAATLREDGVCGNIEVSPYLVGKKVVWFDTEMSEEEVAIFQNSVMIMMGLDIVHDSHPENYFCFRLREYDELSRYAIIDHLLIHNEDFCRKGEIGLMVIDGIADLLLNANDQDSSKALVTRLTQWTDYHKGVSMTAIHTNKDGKDSTGAVGGFLNKKCSYHIRAEKPFGASSTTISSHLARNGQIFPSFQIRHNGNGIPEVVDSDGVIGEDDTVKKRNSKKSREASAKIKTQKEPQVQKIDW
jgi:hypothetical protein